MEQPKKDKKMYTATVRVHDAPNSVHREDFGGAPR